ncbi:MAG: hypothetical protein M3P82_03790, partial [Bacteroidota bacterium]|nr:hypothetical protein [Bacteroidota bacterium]
MKDFIKIIFQIIVKTGMILFLLFESFSSLYSQTSFKYNTPEFFNHNNFRKGSKEKTQLSAGIGSSIRFGSDSKNQFLVSLDFIPRLSNKLFLDLKVDGIK